MLGVNKLGSFVSVIVPVYNDSVRLLKCLDALDKQSYSQDLYETIVIDNGSSEDLTPCISQYKNVKLLYEPIPGSYVARNTGLSEATGSIIAFTDADCIPDSHWLQEGVRCLQSSENCGLVAGRVELTFCNPEKPTSVEIYESIEMGFSQLNFLKYQHYGLTANLFTYKDVIDRVGFFNVNLKSGGDREWGQRVFAHDYKQVYAHKAYVYHPARRTYKELYKRVTRIIGGRFDANKSQMSTFDQFNEFLRDLTLAFTPPGRSLLRVWKNKKLPSKTQKIQFILVMNFVRYVSAWERIRLRLGGTSRRW